MIKSLILTFMVLLSYDLIAQDSCQFQDPEIHLNVDDLEKTLTESLSCPETYYLEDANQSYLLNLKIHSPQTKATILGTTVTGRADMIDLVKKSIGDKPSSFFKANAKSCSDAFCLLKVAFKNDKETAMRAFSIFKETGYYMSTEQSVKDEYIWAKEETRLLHQTLRYLPKDFDHLRQMDKLSIVPKGYSLEGDESTLAWARPRVVLKSIDYFSPGEITFTYNSLKERGVDSAIKTIIHELGHQVDNQTLSDELDGEKVSVAKGFNQLNGWVSHTKKEKGDDGKLKDVKHWTAKAKDSCFITGYAGTQPSEDFAESIAHYFLTPDKLKSKCPKHYAFIKEKIFKGQEFKSPISDLKMADSLKECLEAEPKTYIFTTNNLINVQSIEAKSFNVKGIPGLKFNSDCVDEKTELALKESEAKDQKSFCFFGGVNEMKKSLKENGEAYLYQIQNEIMSAMKGIDWEKGKSLCPSIKYSEMDCIKKYVYSEIQKKADVSEELLEKGLSFFPKITADDILNDYGFGLLMDCMSILNQVNYQASNGDGGMATKLKDRGSVYCSSDLGDKLVKDGILKNKNSMDNFTLVYKFFEQDSVQGKLLKVENEIKTSFQGISCSGFFQSSCLKKKLHHFYKENPDKFKEVGPNLSEKDLDLVIELFL